MWADKDHLSYTLKSIYDKEAVELKRLRDKEMAGLHSKRDAAWKIEAKIRSEAKEREEAMRRVESKKREEAKEYEEAKQREDARKRTVLAHAKATWDRMFAPGREDAKIQMDRNVWEKVRPASSGLMLTSLSKLRLRTMYILHVGIHIACLAWKRAVSVDAGV
ncbi:uncharacterized protein J4E79_002236 [Alternaria viburni]|uniref:uncharacterized protein n=1 Tax=Alternaria viburni TaxID=566460 RepID=UPI0020C59244|nr:uncharacterized protein J4E79_002236 [Alternaria viburni]KAI4667547.1 hypothetical protein J4E79_002236 [Alternaria viburni]